MRPTKALTTIQTMADHSQKWHDEMTSRSIRSSSSNDGLASLVNKLDNLGRDMKKLKESVHAIQVRYGEFGRTTPFNGNNRGKFRVGPPGYYTKTDNRPPYGERRQSLEELLAKHQEESVRRSTEMKIEQLTKELRSKKEKSEQAKVVTIEHEGPSSPNKLKNLHGISFLSDSREENTNDQLHTKESNPGHFTLPCTISRFNFYAMANLGASVNVLPRNIFEYLELTNLSKTRTNMLYEMADMSKKGPLGIVENILVKIDKFLFPYDFVIIDKTPFKTTSLGRPFLATIHAPQSPTQSNNQINYEESGNWHDRSPNLDDSAIVNNPTHRSFDDYKWEFNLEIDKLADEYELGIGKKGHILDNIWEYCNQVHNNNYGWHNHKFKNEEREEMGIEDEDYHPPEVQVETFEVKKYSFEGGHSFVCVSKDLDNVLPLGRKNGSKFKEMIRKEVENNKT
ncbi:zinc knuckle CX2CX4HX4C containing protein [Tanacetum coccineum]